MNWGHKIVIIYSIFIAGILLLVFKSSSQNQDLVASDYYEQELKYQDKIDQTERSNGLSDSIKYEIRDHEMILSFPPEMKGKDISANILLYCIADKRRDIQNNYETKNGEIHLPLPVANKGLHEVKINWKANDVSYYHQHKIMIQ